MKIHHFDLPDFLKGFQGSPGAADNILRIAPLNIPNINKVLINEKSKRTRAKTA